MAVKGVRWSNCNIGAAPNYDRTPIQVEDVRGLMLFVHLQGLLKFIRPEPGVKWPVVINDLTSLTIWAHSADLEVVEELYKIHMRTLELVNQMKGQPSVIQRANAILQRAQNDRIRASSLRELHYIEFKKLEELLNIMLSLRNKNPSY